MVTWSLDADSDTVSRLRGALSEEEHGRAAAFTRDDARRRFVVARGRLRQWLAGHTGALPAELRFAYGPNGKPELAGAALRFNLAHSGESALCAVAEQPIGVDLEQLRPRPSAAALAERWFHSEEVERMRTAEDPLAEFYRTWTRKEAALKLVGVGVGESLPKLLTPAGPRGGLATGLPPNELGLAACRVESLETGRDFAAAVALPFEPS